MFILFVIIGILVGYFIFGTIMTMALGGIIGFVLAGLFYIIKESDNSVTTNCILFVIGTAILEGL